MSPNTCCTCILLVWCCPWYWPIYIIHWSFSVAKNSIFRLIYTNYLAHCILFLNAVMEPPRKAVRSECQFKCMHVCTLYSLSMSTCWWKPHKALRDGIVCLTCDISTHRLSAAIMPAWPRAHMLSSWSTAGDLGIACRMSRHTLQARSSSAHGCMTSRVYFGDWDILPAMPIGGGGRAYSRWRGPDILLSFFFSKTNSKLTWLGNVIELSEKMWAMHSQ